MANANCKKPGSKFASAGNPGKCSRESGILMNSELDDIRAHKKIQPTLDKEAAVQVLTWGNQWVTYDDEKKLKSRLEFARTTCLGGVMVWAVSHYTYDGKYSNSLAGITPHPLVMPGKADDTHVTTPEHSPQCRWTNCGQTCPDGLASVWRSDPGFRKGELMLDSTGCDVGVHTLCCPREYAPQCGWYGHNNGKCSNGCPSGIFEIGSQSYDCNIKDYQTACCTENRDSVRLYWQILGWSAYPKCEDGGCPWGDERMTETLVKSDHGKSRRRGLCPGKGEPEIFTNTSQYRRSTHQYRFDHLRFSSMQAPNDEMHFYVFNRALPGYFRCPMFKPAEIPPY
ncbi:class V chitinase [Aspergillus affinis]|uniref:class V chitinase n=1 Tax=Aspergillus affinis TaxID=1070780 RepID=UPI0022FE302A|nr:class V chitinase [Aspergillus affinis]KAI9044890.1 class V chitinase [Aspergillus affinis]